MEVRDLTVNYAKLNCYVMGNGRYWRLALLIVSDGMHSIYIYS